MHVAVQHRISDPEEFFSTDAQEVAETLRQVSSPASSSRARTDLRPSACGRAIRSTPYAATSIRSLATQARTPISRSTRNSRWASRRLLQHPRNPASVRWSERPHDSGALLILGLCGRLGVARNPFTRFSSRSAEVGRGAPIGEQGASMRGNEARGRVVRALLPQPGGFEGRVPVSEHPQAGCLAVPDRPEVSDSRLDFHPAGWHPGSVSFDPCWSCSPSSACSCSRPVGSGGPGRSARGGGARAPVLAEVPAPLQAARRAGGAARDAGGSGPALLAGRARAGARRALERSRELPSRPGPDRDRVGDRRAHFAGGARRLSRPGGSRQRKRAP